MQAEEYAVFITPNYWMVQLSNIFLLEQRAANLSATDIKQHELKKKETSKFSTNINNTTNDDYSKNRLLV